MGYKVKIPNYDVLPAGLYQARFIEVEEKPGEKEPFLIWHFQVFADDGSSVCVSGASSLKFGPQAKGRQWLDALIADPLESGEEVDFDSVRNRACQVYLTTSVTARGTPINKVEQVIPDTMRVPKLKQEVPKDDDDVPF